MSDWLERNNYKKMTARNLKPGDKIYCWSDNDGTHHASVYVRSSDISGVKMGWDKDSDKVDFVGDRDATYWVPLSEIELFNKYLPKAEEIAAILRGPAYVGDWGYHEMWNGWIGGDPLDMADYMSKDHPLTLIGWAPLDEIKHGWFTNSDIAIIAEYVEDGERFWCHWSRESIDNGLEYFEYKKEKMKNGRV